MKRHCLTVPALAALLACVPDPAEDPANVPTTAITGIPATPPAGLQMLPVENSAHGTVISGGDPQFSFHEYFASADGQFRVDYSSYDEMTAELADWPGDEFMYLIEGRVKITDGSGKSRIYGPGDMLVMPEGFSGTWEQMSPVRTISVSYGWYDDE
jgi:uncharacterized cupin superfamily protein